MEVLFHQRPKCEDILCSIDHDDIGKLDPDEELSAARAARLLGVRSGELTDLAESGALRTQEDEDGRATIAGRDLRRFVKQLKPVRFAQVGGDDEDGYDEYGTDEDDDVPVGSLSLGHLVSAIKKALGTDAVASLTNGMPASAPASPKGAPAVAVAVAPSQSAPTPASDAPDAGRQRNPRAIRTPRQRAK
mgnify:CR=1 FL=1